MRKPKNDRTVELILEKMFRIVGEKKKYSEILELAKQDPNWYNSRSFTPEQENEWYQYGVNLIRKNYRLPKAKAESEMAWIKLEWGFPVR